MCGVSQKSQQLNKSIDVELYSSDLELDVSYTMVYNSMVSVWPSLKFDDIFKVDETACIKQILEAEKIKVNVNHEKRTQFKLKKDI